MNPLLATLGGKLTERWLNSLVLGALFLAATAVGATLGHRHWLDVDRLRTTLDDLAARPALDRTGTAALLVALVLLTATAASLAAQFLGSGIERCWLRFGRDPLSRARTARRAHRWRQKDAKLTRAIEHAHRVGAGPGDAGTSANDALARVQALTEARDRIALREPARPTWYGDRMQAAADRVEAAYGVNLAVLWPRLWLILPEPAVRRLQSARDSFTAAARLAAWAVGCASVARSRARTALEALAELAELIEAAVDVHGRELATRIGLMSPDAPGRLAQDTGDAMSAVFRKAE
ncbi:vegetative cell wall protein gp1 [Streptomyces toyocaensis]|uniref:Vegetative cell wall protein gp1 n=1 Tax=Streptomyces toyocaensis TaxID=55952 RepID=A0A081XZA6_STRTO|nr:hypothetical protein [Streptomyces toyocaensis]KES08879.1 vegetative cell wall protein gp1 [Streptomyces toyocaensis]